MNNCLVTKLAASVNNPDLPKLGAVRFKLKANSSYSGVLSGVTGEESVLSLISGSLTITDYNSGNELPIPYTLQETMSWATLATGEEGAVIEISNRYKGIKRLEAVFGVAEEIDTLGITFSENLQILVTPSSSGILLIGSISDIATCKYLYRVDLSPGNDLQLEGGIADFGPLTSLTNLEIYNSGIKGDLKDLAKAQRASGKNEGSIYFGWLDTDISFNGTPCNKRDNSTLSWTSNTITWDGTTINE